MLEIMALSALTAFLTAVANGAAGEMGKQLLVSTGALTRRTLGRETPLPRTPQERESLAAQLYARMERDPRQSRAWAALAGGLPEQPGQLLGGVLPPAPHDFVNQSTALRGLRREATRKASGRPRVALLSGPPGIGTTSLALRLGATLQDRFPDGRFYVDLRDGAGEEGPAPSAVLLRLLREMGVAPDGMPPTEAGRERLYRQLTEGRRVLVVVDHATSAAQVRGLVPSAPEVFLLVVVSGRPFLLEAQRVAAAPLPDRHAVRIVRSTAGPEAYPRIEPRVKELLEECAGNALALRSRTVGLTMETAETAGPPGGTVWTGGPWGADPLAGAVRRACAGLRPETARLCRLIALAALPAVDAELAAAAADVTPAEAARMLGEAAEARLADALGDGRYRLRPRVRRHLADAAGPEHGIPACAAAVRRTLDALLTRVLHAAHAALPQSWRTEPAPGGGAPRHGEAEGVAVLAAEVGNVTRAVSVADEYGHTATAWRLARALWPLQLKAGYWDEVLPALHLAVRSAAEHAADPRTAGALRFQLAHCLGELGRAEEAQAAARAAVESEHAAGHLRGEASAVELLGLLDLQQWRWRAAYERFTESAGLYRQISSGQEGAEDLPRALALSARHRGRALRGLGELDEAQRLLESAAEFFGTRGEAYNRARALTDLAETLHDAGHNAAALTRIGEAERLLPPQAVPHLQYLAALRLRCEVAAG
ncbi:ATP-binding protein [Streptomyces sp. NPDC029216]|uniref:ATP-binding protein n=1 Tax=Streptomyces sp. NPDC029216 TaxID=3154701 RepID=UPI003400946A